MQGAQGGSRIAARIVLQQRCRHVAIRGEVEAKCRSGLPVRGDLEHGWATQAAVRNQHFFAEGRRSLAGASRRDHLDREAGQVAPAVRVLFIEDQGNEAGSAINDTKAKLLGEVISEAGCTHLRDRQATGGDDQRLGMKAPLRSLDEEAIRLRNRFDLRAEEDVDASGCAFTLQHRYHLQCGPVAEELAKRLLVIADVMSIHQRDHVFRREAGERGLGEVRIFGEEVFGAGVKVGKVAAATPGDQNLFAGTVGMVDQRNTATALASFHGTHQTCGACSQDDDVEALGIGHTSILRGAGNRLCDHRRMVKTVAERPLRIGKPQKLGPAAAIQRRAADRLRAGHLWVYRSDVDELIPSFETEDIAGGSLVTVVDSRGVPLGTAIYSAASQIALRLVSGETAVTRQQYLATMRERLGTALSLREELAPETPENNACRLFFSEADGLPGIVADRYNDLVVVQLLTQGTAQDDVRTLVSEVLTERLQLDTVVERPDPRVRELEQLAIPPSEPLFSRGDAMLATIFTINGVRFHFDAGAGQKTGAFLDQRLNYAAAAQYARGAALDVCTYQGGFALHLARRCDRVTGVDASRTALEVADRNRELNPKLPAKIDWIEADAFDLLREFEASGRHYDTIVLDPPAFAKSKRAAEGALRGYKELNLRAIKMLRPGGTLVTCSCSHHVPLTEFTEVLSSAASDVGKRVQLLETRSAAPDHPAVLTLPETAYLKCLICRVG